MASFEKRGDKWRVRVRLNDYDLSETFDYRADAKVWAADTEKRIRDGKQGNAGRNVVFGDLVQRYIDEVAIKKRGSREEIYRLKRFLKNIIGNVVVDDIQPTDFANWRDNRLKEVSDASVRREMETLSSVCNYAMKEWGLLKDNPLLKISRPKTSKPRSRRPTEDEIAKIAGELHYHDDEPVTMVSQRVALSMYFAIETAMRSGEICNLNWVDVNLEKRTAFLDQTKNGSSRTIPLSKKAVAILNRLQDVDETSVFALDDATRDVLFRRARDASNVEGLHFHDLRREALTRMSKKIDVMMLAKISGHKDVRILMNTYYAPDISSLADLLD